MGGTFTGSEGARGHDAPEASPFARLGPFGAHLGNDINFLRSPSYRSGEVRNPPLRGPLSWRPDGAGFRNEVTELAEVLGSKP